MTDKINGGVKAGEFLTGNMDFFTIVTVVPMAQTNVTTPVADLGDIQNLYSSWQPVTVQDGTGAFVTYSTQASYQDAFNKQANLDTLVRTFALRANPVAVSVSSATVSNPSATTYTGYLNGTAFGNTFTSSASVTTVKLATEKTGLWNVTNATTENNEVGYQLLSAINGVSVADLATPVLPAPVFVTSSTATTDRNTLAVRSLSL